MTVVYFGKNFYSKDVFTHSCEEAKDAWVSTVLREGEGRKLDAGEDEFGINFCPFCGVKLSELELPEAVKKTT